MYAPAQAPMYWQRSKGSFWESVLFFHRAFVLGIKLRSSGPPASTFTIWTIWPAPQTMGNLSKDAISNQGHILRYWSDDDNTGFGGRGVVQPGIYSLERAHWPGVPVNEVECQAHPSLSSSSCLASPLRGLFIIPPLPRPPPKKCPNDCDFPIGMF